MVPKLKSQKEVHWEKKTAIKTNLRPSTTYPVMPTLAVGTYRTRSRSHLECGGGSLGDETCKAPSTVPKRQEAPKCNIFLSNPFLRKKSTKKWNLKVRPQVRGLDFGLPHAVAEARASSPSRHSGAQGREEAEGPRGPVPLTRRQKSAASGGRQGSPSPRSPQACRPQLRCASHVPTPRTPAASPTYCLKPSPTSRPRPTFETNIRAPTGSSHAGVGNSPAGWSVGRLWNARTTFPRMPRGSAGPPRGTLWAM